MAENENLCRNVWIFGGTGFIGKALITCLSKDPKNRLFILLHREFPFRFLESYNTITGNLENFDFTWFRLYPPDIIFHLARISGQNDLLRFFASVRGSMANRRLLNGILSMERRPVIVYVSGSLMYGNHNDQKTSDENSNLNPVSYAKFYFKAEKPFIKMRKQQKVDIRFARPGWIIGPSSWFSIFYWEYYLKNGIVPLYGNGRQLMSVVEVSDCCHQIIDLAFRGNCSQDLNIYSGLPVSQLMFAVTLARILNTGVQKISTGEMKRRYGTTVADAITSSIPLTTLFPETIDRKYQKFTQLETMLRHTISLLKNQ